MAPAGSTGMARLARGVDAVTVAVVVVALVGTVLRLVGLGDRPLHWEEARIGYWTLRYLETDSFTYRPVAGEPLLYLLTRPVFAVWGATDATARLPVALIGGALPLAALLFRDRLRRLETVVFAVLLAGSPALLYYSRFLRGDVPVAAFALVAVGCAIRYQDRRWNGYLYAAAGAAALALASSAFAVGYALCLGLAGVATLDHVRLRGSGARVRVQARSVLAWVRTTTGPIAGAVAVGVVVHLLAFAPRSARPGAPHLWDPTTLPAVLRAAFVEAPVKLVGVRLVSRSREQAGHELIPFVTGYAELLVVTALPILVLAVVVALADRYWEGSPRPVVAFAVYWFGAGLLVFPIVTETMVPWVLVHLTLPLLLPAAVAGGWLLRTGVRAFQSGQAGTVLAVVFVLLAASVATGATATAAYEDPERTQPLVDYAQPGSDLEPLVADVSAAIEGNDGTDVLYYGSELHLAGEDPAARPPVPAEWGDRLPLPWYFARIGAETDSVADEQVLAEREDVPPVIVADRRHRSTLASRLDGYEATEYDLALWDRAVVVFVRQ